MGVNSLPETVTRQRRGYDLNPGPSAPESNTLTTRLLSHPVNMYLMINLVAFFNFNFYISCPACCVSWCSLCLRLDFYQVWLEFCTSNVA